MMILRRVIDILTGNTGDVGAVHPNLAAASSATSGAANVKGSWVQVVASTTEDLVINSAEIVTIAGVHQVDIGTGASGSESSICNFAAGTTGCKTFKPAKVLKGSRIAIRTSSVAGTQAITMYLNTSTSR
jgi:hypothetical protein